MASISGSQTNMGVKVATTWGTAVAAGTANRFIAEANVALNGTELTPRQIGSGAYMLTTSARGNYIPTISLTADLGYRNNCDVIIAALFGTAGAPAETTVGQGDYKHTITFNTTLNAKYLTFAYESSSATTHEFPTCAVRSIGLKTNGVPGIVDFTAELLAGQVNLSSSTNTNATLAATTFTEGTPELAVANLSSTFQTNAQSAGAVSSGSQYNITGFDFSFTRPQEIVGEIKGAAGNSAPTSTGYADGNFNVTVKELADHAYYTIWSAETIQKAALSIQGTQIGSGTNKEVKLFLPGLKLVGEPVYAPTQPGVNTLALNFGLRKASSNPTSMSSTYPYFTITNTLATSLLA